MTRDVLQPPPTTHKHAVHPLPPCLGDAFQPVPRPRGKPVDAVEDVARVECFQAFLAQQPIRPGDGGRCRGLRVGTVHADGCLLDDGKGDDAQEEFRGEIEEAERLLLLLLRNVQCLGGGISR